MDGSFQKVQLRSDEPRARVAGCEWDDADLKIAEKGMCVAEDLVETIAPYARAHAEKLAQAASRE